MVRHLLPAAFADVSDIWVMPRRRRVAVLLVGPVSTVIWAALATGLWAWTRPGSFIHLLGGAVMLASFLGVWVSLNPVGGYDGSEVLSEWLEVPDLHRRALNYGWAKLRGRPQPSPPPRVGRIFWGYSLGVLVYNLAVLALVLVLLIRSVLS
jgi:putative peptide zinc metalloprotease protein